MKLYIVHAGYYDNEIGIYEMHTNFIQAAEDIKDLKRKINELDVFKKKNMHIDAVQEIITIDGYTISLNKDPLNQTKLISYDYSQIKELS